MAELEFAWRDGRQYIVRRPAEVSAPGIARRAPEEVLYGDMVSHAEPEPAAAPAGDTLADKLYGG